MRKLEKPVISVGNITMGGVGKTPMVEFIASLLKEQHVSPVILTRGYMGAALRKEQSDEVALLNEALQDVPVLPGKNRFLTAAKFLEQNEADIFIMDDGFQHIKMDRDLDILAIDATNPFGNGYLIPGGILREPIPGLKRADLFVITKSDIGRGNVEDIKKIIKNIKPDSLIVEAIHRPKQLRCFKDNAVYPLDLLRDKSICSFCSIGNPKSFEKTLISLGANIKRNFAFMDHHIYAGSDVGKVVKYACSHDIKFILSTSKDEVKVRRYAHLFINEVTCLILDVKLEIVKGKEELNDRIFSILHR